MADKRLANLTNAGKGRRKGVPNKATRALKEVLNQNFPPEVIASYLKSWLDHSDPQLKAKAMDYVLKYGTGLPVPSQQSEDGIADAVRKVALALGSMALGGSDD